VAVPSDFLLLGDFAFRRHVEIDFIIILLLLLPILRQKQQRPAQHKIGHFGESPPGNHLQWYGQQKLAAKSIKPTHKENKMQ